MISKYKKLIAYVVGIGVLLASDFFGVKLPFGAEQITDFVILALTGFGIWKATNAT